MTDQTPESPRIRSYFVDEAGDPTLFGRRGKKLVGTEGCSSYFILGKLDIADPDSLGTELNALRTKLLSDPYFSGVPSMQPDGGKTAIAFHAKDDLPEVRREVFNVLLRHDVQFYSVIRDKSVIASKVQAHNAKHPAYRYHPNQLYDKCVSQLFKERLHKDAGYTIFFARRGKSDRTEALEKALEAARNDFRKRWGVTGTAPIEIVPSSPRDVAGLQAVDYFLWALQRFYERGEDRFLNLIWPQTKLVIDVDDTRHRGYGEYYTQSHPLTLASRAKK
ncbi:MAG: DUF3800 domain-containing protein [Planctomycetaceae bacterium]